MTRAETVGVVGAGRFGTALGSVLARAGRRVVMWSRDEDVVRSIQATRRNPRSPEVPLPEPLEATADPGRLATEARFLVLAVASADVDARSRELGDVIDGSHIVVHAVGALAMPGHERMSEVMTRGLPTLKLGVLAGPALPADLAQDLSSDLRTPSGSAAHPSSDRLAVTSSASMVVASVFDEVVAEGRRLLNAPPSLRVYGSRDLVGVELASALVGAYTVGLGLSDGMGIGVGPRAVLITRIIAEGSRLAIGAGAQVKTFAGLAGLGNLLVRAGGATPAERSADYLLGRRLAEGGAPTGAALTEGARAAIAGCELAATLGVRMPVLDGIAAVLAGKVDPREAAKLVMDSVASEE